MTPLIRCGFGIGNRVATMANALSRHDEIRFVWRVNPSLPVDHHEIFPNGIEGVEFVDAPPGFATRWHPKIAGESWAGADDRNKANAAYGRIMDAVAGNGGNPPEVAIIARFWRFPHADEITIAKTAAQFGKPVFVLADSRRWKIGMQLQESGAEIITPNGPEMTSDSARTRESTLQYLSDWKRATSAKIIVTHHNETSVTFPAMAAGKRIVMV